MSIIIIQNKYKVNKSSGHNFIRKHQCIAARWPILVITFKSNKLKKKIKEQPKNNN